MTYKDCELLPNPANDGDSFHVRAGRREYIFRLYFVDTPETDVSIPDRVAEQAKYFGVTVPQTLQIGLEAERYTREKLSRPFTVITCKEDARGRSRLPRYFAFVELHGESLAEDLIANGLARVYGAKADAPNLHSAAAEEQQLHQLERRAKAQELAGWGVDAGRLSVRAAVTPPTSSSAGTESFDAFFHPNGTPAPVPATITTTASNFASPKSGGAKGQLDLNTTSSETLQSVPYIGPADHRLRGRSRVPTISAESPKWTGEVCKAPALLSLGAPNFHRFVHRPTIPK